jgi:diguanylate cyclase (GGDEF)-like protein/PAS domain S-box-containing protein
VPATVTATFPRRPGARWRSWGALLGCVAALAAHAQPATTTTTNATLREFYFQTTGIEQGLAENTVSAILQDQQGYLWVGSDGPLQRYDGYRFVNYAPAANQNIASPSIAALAQDTAGRIWVGTTENGLLRLLPGAQSLEKVAIDAADVHSAYTLLADAKHGLWVGSERGILLVDPASGALRQRWNLSSAGVAPFVRGLAMTPDGMLWVAATNGLWRVDPDAMQAERIDAARIAAASTLLVDSAGRLRVGTADGLYGVDGGGNAQRLWPAQGSFAVNAIAEDPRQRLWLGVSGHGIAIVEPVGDRTRWLRPDPLTPGSLSDNDVTLLMLDRSGLLWLGSHDRGLSRTDPAGTPFRYVADHNANIESPDLNNVAALAADARGDVWIGGAGGLKRYRIDENRFESETRITVLDGDRAGSPQSMPAVNAIAASDTGGFWLATTLGVGRFDPQKHALALLAEPVDGAQRSIADAQPHSLAVGSGRRLWIGMMRGGLARYDIDSGRWTRFRHDGMHDNEGLGSNAVFALHEDRNGRLWVGTSNGLNLVDPASGVMRLFRHVQDDVHSLSSNAVLSIHENSNGELWIGTQSGLNRLDALDVQRAHFSHWPQGLDAGAIHSIEDDGLGRLWLGTSRGFASLDTTSNTWQAYAPAQGLQGLNFNSGASTRLSGGELAFGGGNGIAMFRPQNVVGSRFVAPVVLTAVQVGANETAAPSDHVRMRTRDGVVRFEFAALDYAAPERNRFAYQLEGFDERWIEAGSRNEAVYANLESGHYVFRVRGSNRDGFWSPAIARADLDVIPPWWSSLAAKTAYVLLGFAAVFALLRAQRMRHREVMSHHHDLRDREDRLRLALWGSGDDFWDWDMAGDRIMFTGSRQLFMGADARTDAKFSHWFRDNLHPDDAAQVERNLDAHTRGDTETYEAEYRLRTRDGNWVWILARGRIVERDAHGQPLRMCGTTRDITADRAAAQERRIAHEVLRSMGEAVVVTDLDFRFTTVNPAFTHMTGWQLAEVRGEPISVLDCARQPGDVYRDLREKLAANGEWRGELWQRRKDGEEFLSWCEVLEVRDSGGARTHFVSVITDITDRKRAEQELRYLANYDALTGLPNRSLLIERIDQGIARARRTEKRLAVLFLDLDRFKHVNDSMGHAAGDSLLRAAGARLRHIVRGNDSVARIGGDEFTVVLEDIDASADAEAIAGKILSAFEEPLELDNGQEVVISASIGISLFPDHGATANDLLKFADTAMYQAKEHGRRIWMIYIEAMDAAARLRAMTVAAMRKALERDEFQLRYQPKMSLQDERITGFEALLRWRSAEMGDISPGVFIPIAEETGMIVEIGDWVIEQACHQLARWRDEGLGDVALSINLSVAQLMHTDLVRRLSDVLAAHDIPPSLLELELTESMVMANAEQSITMLRRLKAVGVSLAIDDFGTGYSSLSYLKRLPIDALKIDKEFVGDLTSDPDDEAITATVIAMAHSLGLNVIAEGVEHVEQVNYLREQDCDEIQGHWLSEPLRPEQCPAFMQAHAQKLAVRASRVEAAHR